MFNFFYKNNKKIIIELVQGQSISKVSSNKNKIKIEFSNGIIFEKKVRK